MTGIRNVYLGTSEFAATVLRRLSDSDHRPTLIVAPPDRRRGRGRRLLPPPVAEAANELGIDLLQAESVNDPGALERIRAAEPLLGVVCAFGQLIREPLLSEIPMLNAHPSLLPRWRGAAPIERAIMAGDEATGVSVIRLVEALDAGPMALARTIAIGPDKTYGDLALRLASLAGDLLVEALDLKLAGRLEFADQDDAAATYAEKIGPADRRLDPSRSAIELAAQVRALTPHIGAYLELPSGERLGIRGARSAPENAPVAELSQAAEMLRLGTGEGTLLIDTVQPAGGKPMSAADFLRGHEL